MDRATIQRKDPLTMRYARTERDAFSDGNDWLECVYKRAPFDPVPIVGGALLVLFLILSAIGYFNGA